ncbi:HAD family hydrolase [Uliginosibacterium gangwonense]|uniref:HAD family hydrolase n=1 Tax=Uliginosibacterium gangwonense TaxID=392736 RepID=UPI0003712A83|nr:HAD family hydrolase [Uliginosibacterium gangwonense]
MSITSPQPAILFDLDETLVDRCGGLRRFAHRLWQARKPDMDKQAFVSLFIEIDEKGHTPRPEFFARFCAQALPDEVPEALSAYFYSTAWHESSLFPDAEMCLRTLRERGYRIGIVSNGTTGTQNTKIKCSVLPELVDSIVISETVGYEKPDPRIYQHALSELGAETQSTWFIGDNPEADVLGAHASGITPIWIERHLAWPDHAPRSYSARISSLSEVLDVLP